MFKPNNKANSYKYSSFTNTTKIIGDITSTDDIRIDGYFKGNIKVQQKVVIAEKAIVNGNIEAKNISVYGKINGEIKVAQLIEIQSEAVITDNIYTREIAVSKGGIINGKIITTKQKDKL